MTRPIDLCLDYAETVEWPRAFVIRGAMGCATEYYVQYMYDTKEKQWHWTAGGTVGGAATREKILEDEVKRDNVGWRVQPDLSPNLG